MAKSVVVLWKVGRPRGRVEIVNGKLAKLSFVRCKGGGVRDAFTCTADGCCRVKRDVAAARTEPGAGATLVSLRTRENPFSFFLRDVTKAHPIYLPAFGVAVTESDDLRSYAEIERDVASRGLVTSLQRIALEPEETFEAAAAATRELRCQTWLGLSRDMRIFGVGFREGRETMDWIQPRFHGYEVPLPENKDQPIRYSYVLGRGIGPVDGLTRRLEDGVLPILHGRLIDEDIRYEFTTFVSFEKSALTAQNVRGTHYLVADGYGAGHMFTPEQERVRERLLPAEMAHDEETVLYFQARAVNTAAVPRYAWFHSPVPWQIAGWKIGRDGLCSLPSGRVYCVAKLNGKPLRDCENAILVPPGEAATLEFYVPHQPISKERARRLARQSFSKRHAECRAYWQKKLGSGASMSLPEQRLDEMARAGLLHLDVVAYGREPKGSITANIGVYCPIGSESSPIIQFFDSMGWHDVARRALHYFLDKQHEDGFIQNFGGYMLETGPALWSMGEHYRYTRDEAWVRRIAPKLLKSADFILRWRDRNKKPGLKGKGWGMLDGKVADPVDPYYTFMLNGYAYLGLSRVSEMLAKTNPAQSRRLAREAAALKADIRESFFASVARAPVVPLGDGTWCPTAPPWAGDAHGPLVLFAEAGRWYTHGTFMGRDSMLGPLYLVFQEVIEPHEPAADWLVNYHADLMTQRNGAFSQPYYSRHLWCNLRRGEVKPFLKGYYATFSALADRETYTFWEHFFHASPHKTHEEGWFLMQTRWMLYMEQGDMLKLLPGIPRRWLEHGKTIELNNVASYFGPVSLRVESNLAQGWITAGITANSPHRPKAVLLRLPHPEGLRAVNAVGGRYDAQAEAVLIKPFTGRAAVRLEF